MKILVVEDEVDLARAVREALQSAGYAVDDARDGEVGLYQALTWEYDAIVLDLMLPLIDGWTLLEKLRAERSTCGIRHHAAHLQDTEGSVARLILSSQPQQLIEERRATLLPHRLHDTHRHAFE